MVAVVYGAGQLVESIYLTPRLVGERIGLHPLAVIFALLAFGQVLGFLSVCWWHYRSVRCCWSPSVSLKEGYLASRLYQG